MDGTRWSRHDRGWPQHWLNELSTLATLTIHVHWANSDPANIRHSPNAVSMLAHRLRRWPNIKTALGECLVFAEESPYVFVYWWSFVWQGVQQGTCLASILKPLRSAEQLCLDATCGRGGGPRVVVSTTAFHARVRGSVPGLGGLKETNNVSSPSTCESQYCGEPPWPRGSVLGLRPPGLEFRILCLEDSVISIISPSSGGSPGPV